MTKQLKPLTRLDELSSLSYLRNDIWFVKIMSPISTALVDSAYITEQQQPGLSNIDNTHNIRRIIRTRMDEAMTVMRTNRRGVEGTEGMEDDFTKWQDPAIVSIKIRLYQFKFHTLILIPHSHSDFRNRTTTINSKGTNSFSKPHFGLLVQQSSRS